MRLGRRGRNSYGEGNKYINHVSGKYIDISRKCRSDRDTNVLPVLLLKLNVNLCMMNVDSEIDNIPLKYIISQVIYSAEQQNYV